jgi:hypothetical protein
MSYTYSYLSGVVGLFVIWLVLFFWRKDVREEMFALSLVFGIGGLLADYFYSDWWIPETITGTLPGIESFLFGFFLAGIASVCYIEVFGKKIREKRNDELYKKKLFWLTPITILVIFIFSIRVLGLNSYEASFPAYLIPLGFILYKRPDLITDSLLSGFVLILLSFVFYWIPEIIFPGWIESTWNFELISGIFVLGVPLEDVIWIFMTGLVIGPLYEFWKGSKIVDVNRKNDG